MEIKEEILDQIIDNMERMKPVDVNGMSVQIGEYKGFNVCVMLQKPENEAENNRLATSRDTLLPKLMSGDIK